MVMVGTQFSTVNMIFLHLAATMLNRKSLYGWRRRFQTILGRRSHSVTIEGGNCYILEVSTTLYSITGEVLIEH